MLSIFGKFVDSVPFSIIATTALFPKKQNTENDFINVAIQSKFVLPLLDDKPAKHFDGHFLKFIFSVSKGAVCTGGTEHYVCPSYRQQITCCMFVIRQGGD
ncbi:Uncharacterised protein at_DN2122 [Pycnogonum litorale]